MGEWIKAADISEINEIFEFEYNNREIVIFRYNDEFFALDNICSHEYARLSEGELWDSWIYCPKHGSCFDIRNGGVKGLPAVSPVKSFRTKTDGTSLYIFFEDEY